MLKPYESYKETNIDWLNSIPEHWKWLYLSQVSSEQQIKNKDNLEYNVLSLSYGNIIRKKNKDFGLVPKEYDNYQIVDSGNIILRLTDLQNDKKSLRTGLVKERGIITSAYTCLKPKENANFLHCLLHSFDTKKVFYGMGGGVRQSIGYSDIRNMRLPVPPRAEQDQIVHYLDWQLSKINKLIKAKKKQIALLNEQKQAIINKAVTKGLDDTVPMKDSGVEWIGEIPRDWEVNRLKTVISLYNEKTLDNNQFYIGMENIKAWTGEYIETEKAVPESTSNKFKKNCLLFGKLRPYLAKAYITNCDGICSGEFLVFDKSSCDMEFIKYALLSPIFIDLVNSSTYGAKMPRANWTFIGNCFISYPNIVEQQIIVSFIKKITSKIDYIINKSQKEIDLINEYKTSLISSVVTGKVDVRDIEIPDFAIDEQLEFEEEETEDIEEMGEE